MEQVTPNQKNQQKLKHFIPHDEYKELLDLLASNQLVINNLNTADDGSQFTDECMYIADPNSEIDIILSEEYQDQYNTIYDEMEEYINSIGIYSEWYRDNQIDSQE